MKENVLDLVYSTYASGSYPIAGGLISAKLDPHKAQAKLRHLHMRVSKSDDKLAASSSPTTQLRSCQPSICLFQVWDKYRCR